MRIIMKALSIIQPWASLIVAGIKRYETRKWYTPYRGPMLIHASTRISPALKQMCVLEPFNEFLAKIGKNFDDLPRGAIIGRVTIIACHATSELKNISYDEICLGDYTCGHWAWELTNAKTSKPFVLSGRLGLFEIKEPPQ